MKFIKDSNKKGSLAAKKRWYVFTTCDGFFYMFNSHMKCVSMENVKETCQEKLSDVKWNKYLIELCTTFLSSALISWENDFMIK